MSRSPASLVHAANQALIVEGRLDAINEFFSPDYVAHFTGSDLAGGHDAVRRVITAIRNAFSDITLEVDVLVESGDRIAWLRTASGTQTGSFKGFPASDKKLRWCDMVTSEIRDGLIVQEWVVTDLAEQLLLARKR
ncbi:ester cyclase [Uliginosibacterium sp. H1]|uniref:ester cyclase n=1 Tax=Uliginosibacterium sp. H1 TaxID=3114757 RepID=UPI002E194144|nr:ester cyclase [Uliginosibacterium sp. H1]